MKKLYSIKGTTEIEKQSLYVKGAFNEDIHGYIHMGQGDTLDFTT